VSDVSDVGSSLPPGTTAPTTTSATTSAPALARAATPFADATDLREQGALFRSLLETPRKAREWADAAGGGLQQQASIGAGHASQTAAATPSGAPDPAVAQLMEWHIRRILASAGSDRAADEIRIELSDAVFPGTALTLKRTADGWHLAATADNRHSLDELNRFAPALVERFAQASLGRLQVTLDG
jgi:hypothetical protein